MFRPLVGSMILLQPRIAVPARLGLDPYCDVFVLTL